ncbi:MAG: glycosyltransferase family 2 protein [Planctomycetaceae bacterium]
MSSCISVFIFAKDEAANIGKCLECLRRCGASAIVLDSGSADQTQEIASGFDNAEVRPFVYRNHHLAYNEITTRLVEPGDWAMILDADMEVSPALWDELHELAGRESANVLVAPVRMYVDGMRLSHGSLYPPKPIVFRAGAEYFVAKGHGEKLIDAARTQHTQAELGHNDLKPFERFLASQVRYADNTWRRVHASQSGWFDRLSLTFPIRAIVTPLVSYVVRGGALSGIAGLVYALDIVVASLIQYRCFLSRRLHNPQLPVDAAVPLSTAQDPAGSHPTSARASASSEG